METNDNMLYLAALLHDIGKPSVAEQKENSNEFRYHGHADASESIVRDSIVPNLRKNGIKISEKEEERLCYYVVKHDGKPSLRTKSIRKHLRMGATWQDICRLMRLKRADIVNHALTESRLERLTYVNTITDEKIHFKCLMIEVEGKE